jgi:hypothetical protein
MKALLGPAVERPVQTTGLGIRYQAQGFDHPRDKKMNKSARWLRKRKVPEYVVSAFIAYVQSLIADPNYLARQIDAAWQERQEAWQRCGPGTWQHRAATESHPSTIVVVIEAAAFTVDMGAFGTRQNVGGDTDGRTIRAVICAIPFAETDASKSYLRKFDQIVRWEIGNTFHRRAGGRFTGNPDQEIGDKDPCGLARP